MALKQQLPVDVTRILLPLFHDPRPNYVLHAASMHFHLTLHCISSRISICSCINISVCICCTRRFHVTHAQNFQEATGNHGLRTITSLGLLFSINKLFLILERSSRSLNFLRFSSNFASNSASIEIVRTTTLLFSLQEQHKNNGKE